MVAVILVYTFVRALRFRFVTQVLAQVTFARALVGL